MTITEMPCRCGRGPVEWLNLYCQDCWEDYCNQQFWQGVKGTNMHAKTEVICQNDTRQNQTYYPPTCNKQGGYTFVIHSGDKVYVPAAEYSADDWTTDYGAGHA